MTDDELKAFRGAVRRGEMPEELLEELKEVVVRMARLRLLPPSFAPYGHWDEEAAEEAFSEWYAARLLGRGHLQAILDRARTGGAFRRLAERSLRHHLLNARDRSQAHNLYRRVVELLNERERFILFRGAARPQDRWYVSSGSQVTEWHDPERELISFAWSLGEFAVIRYRANAAKLSPVLDATELERFVSGLLERTQAALTPQLIMVALNARFDLGNVEVVDLGHAAELAEPLRTDEVVALEDTARAVVAALTERQRRILRGSDHLTIAELAGELGCSVGTVINEQRRIGSYVARLSENDDERDELLNILHDHAYLDIDG